MCTELTRPSAPLPYEAEVVRYLKLASRWLPARVRGFASEAALLANLGGAKQRPVIVLCDPRGKILTSREFAVWIGGRRDAGAGSMVLAVGPADGWSTKATGKADMRLSLRPMTLPHALARLVLAEQMYRAATILGGHPLSSGTLG